MGWRSETSRFVAVCGWRVFVGRGVSGKGGTPVQSMTLKIVDIETTIPPPALLLPPPLTLPPARMLVLLPGAPNNKISHCNAIQPHPTPIGTSGRQRSPGGSTGPNGGNRGPRGISHSLIEWSADPVASTDGSFRFQSDVRPGAWPRGWTEGLDPGPVAGMHHPPPSVGGGTLGPIASRAPSVCAIGLSSSA